MYENMFCSLLLTIYYPHHSQFLIFGSKLPIFRTCVTPLFFYLWNFILKIIGDCNYGIVLFLFMKFYLFLFTARDEHEMGSHSHVVSRWWTCRLWPFSLSGGPSRGKVYPHSDSSVFTEFDCTDCLTFFLFLLVTCEI